ncbi:flagellar hook-basal body protein [Mediterraneibacter agrestimuris]|uniref:flagellar hook-basal body protein n=1 Tax=Mediterraneibacter agrestimuris TaxID=2941333 RepID=UPI002042505C|nr:flagellar hook-basal body protein [Mediterraneibacter agrestimuris]
MFQGFYNLASNLIVQNRNMNVISNNMTNISTPGFKNDQLLQGTFQEEILYRFERGSRSPVGTTTRINMADEVVTDYTPGGLRETERSLDFALSGNGFFSIQSGNGTVYTRNGSFNIDDEGYLVLQGMGRVLGENGPIRVNTEEIYVNGQGFVLSEDGYEVYGRISVVDFENYEQLSKAPNGAFRSNAQPQAANGTSVKQKFLEDSNVTMAEEMTSMMAGQRALQSSAQLLKMYDQLSGKAIQLGSQ